MYTFGKNIELAVAGADAGPCVIVTLGGLPAGLPLEIEAAWHKASGRAEGDKEQKDMEMPATFGGLRDGVTDGAAITAVIPAQEEPAVPLSAPRPGSDDFARMAKSGDRDFSGGAYSGRINTALAFAGALAAQALAAADVIIGARVIKIGQATGQETDFEMKRELLDARGTGDTVGSVVECVVEGIPAGEGAPVFGGIESRAASLMFSVPGVKGVEFGLGFGFAGMRGSFANDPIVIKNGAVAPGSNNSGGADAGLTTGEPLIMRIAVRPGPFVGREQKSVDLDTMREVSMRLRGRHEPCLGIAALPAIEGAAALAVLDTLLDSGGLYGRIGKADEA